MVKLDSNLTPTFLIFGAIKMETDFIPVLNFNVDEIDIALLEEKRKRFQTKASALANAFGVPSDFVLHTFALAQYKTWLHCEKFLPKEKEHINDDPLINLLLWDIVREKLSTEKSAKEALTDPLTKLFNRRAFDEAVKRLAKNYMRQEREKNENPFSLIFCDLDHFKMINDNFGHSIGDEVLKEVSKVALSLLRRPTDFLARFGGEEFVIIVEGNSQSAFDLANQIRESIAMIPVDILGIDPNICSRITASFGVSEYVPLNNDSETAIKLLIDRADKALYNAKERGRNRTAMKNH